MQNVKVLIGFLCLFSGYAAAAPAASDKDVATAVDHLTQAMLHKDIPQLQALTANNLTYGHSSGKVQNKQEFIADIETGRSGFKTLEMQKQTITLNGDTALVRNHFSAQAVNGGVEVPTEIENFQVWQKQKGKWLLIGRQAYKF
ncbi:MULTISPECIES: nuclear transport factor 2 family protein [unclassified Pseudomonas]|uniref:nuclear transport factor 2 family protein n=1 Tax=unclassified Pseudomonas TaxID=196821 RepID=UPI0015A2E6FA|nr:MULTISPECIES: nuclear transport factor 2 family protein [unclassified Pseudomonas]NVZ16321.1 nuclear transport factor 2 family protein [Pseudomonas sp. IPO3775]NWA77060.1 nuclear transport factor 2 family protein [Pseudomonas sp. C8002]